jgi:hypothetical protein
MPGQRFTSAWLRNWKPLAEIRVQAERDTLELSYRLGLRGQGWRDVEERVWLTWTHCRYGGHR